MAESQRGANSKLAIMISYPTSTSGVTVLLKTPTKLRELFPTLFVKTNDFQLVFNFEQTRTVLVWRAWYNGSYTLMAKPITTRQSQLANQNSRIALSVFNEKNYTDQGECTVVRRVLVDLHNST